VDLIDKKSTPVTVGKVTYKWIISLKDHYTRWVWATALPNKEGPFALCRDRAHNSVAGETVANATRQILGQLPRKIGAVQCDNGSEFVSKEFKAVARQLGSTIVHSGVKKPSTNGSIENANKIIKLVVDKRLIALKDGNWVEALPDGCG
jgi:transposase InsO family protein